MESCISHSVWLNVAKKTVLILEKDSYIHGIQEDSSYHVLKIPQVEYITNLYMDFDKGNQLTRLYLSLLKLCWKIWMDNGRQLVFFAICQRLRLHRSLPIVRETLS